MSSSMSQPVNPYQAQIEQIDQEIKENQALLEDSELAALAQQEIERLQNQKQQLESAAEDFSQATQKEDAPQEVSKSDAIFELRGGAGGDEAKIWAQDLMRMYQRFAENNGLKIEYIDDLVFKIRGKLKKLQEDGSMELVSAYTLFKYESGVHRVQRVPVTESQGRIHTSTASVAVLPVVKASTIEIRDEDLEWQFIRAGGAGGQSVNKTSSAVRLTHVPSGISVSSSRERKQVQNRAIALDLLASQLWEIEEEKRAAKIGDARSAIGRNMRAEKIRTYNFPQNRVTDHRINKSWHRLDSILEGDILDVMETVKEELEKES